MGPFNFWDTGSNWNISYPSEHHTEPKYEMSRNLVSPSSLRNRFHKFCPEYGSITAMFYAKFPSYTANGKWIIGKLGFMRFVFKIRFERLSSVARATYLVASSFFLIRIKSLTRCTSSTKPKPKACPFKPSVTPYVLAFATDFPQKYRGQKKTCVRRFTTRNY